ncbi:Collagen alpha-1(XIV) chain [Labeo rohita]|uniref:Collagen alpha-1(XIV) chain n=1 Tax=Labeo rohita TaxID=84645 RepID=A0ABQ8LAH7_LABRO|nr:Collagen alpha-1(XIV) chain [Labeo rohita]
MILVDELCSIGLENFKTVKNFLESFVGSFTVGSNQTRIGLVQYSRESWIEWHLNTHSTKETMINADETQSQVHTHTKSQDDVLSPAQRLRDAGIELFAIGVKNPDENELRAIASPPEEKTHVYNGDDFSFTSDILEKLTRSVCERISELNGGFLRSLVFNTRSDAPSDLMTSEVTARRFCVTHPVNL